MTRYSFGRPEYDDPSVDKCWELWHAELRNGPHCAFKEIGHDGPHEGRGFQWDKECLATAEQAAAFFRYYQAIPNSKHEIWLNDDGSVGMTLRGFADAVLFIGANMHGD